MGAYCGGGKKRIISKFRCKVLLRPNQSTCQVGRGLSFVQPAFVIWNDGGGTDQPNPRFLFYDQNLTVCKLFAERNLPVGTDDLDGWGDVLACMLTSLVRLGQR